MVPFYAARITQFHDTDEMLRREVQRKLPNPRLNTLKCFRDTAINGNAPALDLPTTRSGDHLLFGTDMPYDNSHGDRDIRETIQGYRSDEYQ
jgi:hypothetical protein